jgi:uncharacterized caspase-like protein
MAIAPAADAGERRIALVIGNGAYNQGALKNPVNDAQDIAKRLSSLGFEVRLEQNVGRRVMEEAISAMGEALKKGGVGLFYYAGHGVQIGGRNFLIPVGAHIDKETDVQFEAVDAARVLAEMDYAGNQFNLVILDACRDNPFARSFRSASRGLAIISLAPTGTIIAYATSPGQTAADGEGRNSPYTAALLKHMATPGLPVESVFKNVRAELYENTRGKQTPWELSSLRGSFSFNPTDGRTPVGAAELREIEAERQRLVRERELLAERRALEAERRKLAEEREALKLKTASPDPPPGPVVAMGTPPSSPASPRKISSRDGRFTDNGDGTVTDHRLKLMWAKVDVSLNRPDIAALQVHVRNLSVGGYADWRFPTREELWTLYEPGKTTTADNISKATLQVDPIFQQIGNALLSSKPGGFLKGDWRVMIDFVNGRESEAWPGYQGGHNVRPVRKP